MISHHYFHSFFSKREKGMINTWYLVKEDHVDEAVVEHQGFPGAQQFSEQRPDVDAVVIRSSLTFEGRERTDIQKSNISIYTATAFGTNRCNREAQWAQDRQSMKHVGVITLLFPPQ